MTSAATVQLVTMVADVRRSMTTVCLVRVKMVARAQACRAWRAITAAALMNLKYVYLTC